jgi:hypothetical protein
LCVSTSVADPNPKESESFDRIRIRKHLDLDSITYSDPEIKVIVKIADQKCAREKLIFSSIPTLFLNAIRGLF